MTDKKRTKEQLINELATMRQRVNELERAQAEHKQREEALHEIQEMFRLFMEHSPIYVFFKDENSRAIGLSRNYEKMLGRPVRELIGKTMEDLFPSELAESMVRDDLKILNDGKPIEVIEELNDRWYATTKFPIAREGKPRLLAGFTIDITERRRVEEALRKSEERFRGLYDRAPVGYHEYDTEGRIISVNRTELEMLGYTAEEVIGQFAWRFSIEEESARRDILAKLAGKLPPAKNLERAYRRKDGTPVPVLIENQLVLDETGQIKSIRSTVQDITWRKRAEEDRKSLEARLQRVEKMEALGTLAGGVAHDLNNILSGLVGYPDLILMQLPEGSPLREPILGVKRSGQKSAAIVQDLLTLTRRGMVSLEVINLNSVISDYLATPEQEKTRSFHPHVRFEVSLESNLLPIKGSRVHLSKTVMNLVSNAAEAMPEGGVAALSTRNQYVDRPIKGYDQAKEGDYAVLEVSDTGRGISPEDMGRIFEPFYTKKKMGRSGTGLGLAVVWGTVKDHSGYIDVRSEEGKGTTFTLYFPVTRETLTQERPPVSLSDYMGKGETILVVDDVLEQRELAAAMLRKLHYQVTSVSSGEAAVEYMKTGQADILILDMIMDPGMDGLETYRKILEFRPGQKAIIASGFSETERVSLAQNLGAGAFFKKPYTLEEIGLLVRQELDQ